MFKQIFLLGSLFFSLSTASAFKDRGLYLGVGFYSQNAFNRTVNSATGSTGFFGTTSYPIYLKQDWSFASNWFFSPQLSYTIIPRDSTDGAAKNTLTHINVAFGQNFSDDWEWSIAPGILRHDIKGNGGSKQLNNGNGYSTFALPGRSVAIHSITVTGGVGYELTKGRLGFDIIFENFLSSDKRSQNFFLSYAYLFGGF